MRRRRVTAPCTQCHQVLEFVKFEDNGHIVDSVGGMKFNNGWVCDSCLGGRAIGDSLDAMRRLGGQA